MRPDVLPFDHENSPETEKRSLGNFSFHLPVLLSLDCTKAHIVTTPSIEFAANSISVNLLMSLCLFGFKYNPPSHISLP